MGYLKARAIREDAQGRQTDAFLRFFRDHR